MIWPFVPVFAIESIHFNPWELIIYRSENFGEMNEVRCYVNIYDIKGNDVTYTACSATYEWVSIPDRINYYQNLYYLMGGMAMHLNLKGGKYIIKVSTPISEIEWMDDSVRKNFTGDFLSNEFYYDTENPTKVIFVVPTANDNGFYNGGWFIDYKSPSFYKYTKPRR